VTWEDLIAAFLYSRRERQAAPGTLQAYRTDLARFAAWCASHRPDGPLDPTQAAPLDLAAYRSRLMESMKPSTVNGAVSALRTLFAWAAEERLLPHNPARHLRRAPEVMLGPQALAREVLTRLLAAASRRSHRDTVLIILLAHTGLRVSEALDLTWADIRLRGESGVVVVQRGKGIKYREVPLNASTGRLAYGGICRRWVQIA
jgi:integrase/recombinase XerD